MQRLLGTFGRLGAVVLVGRKAQAAMPLARLPDGVRVFSSYRPSPRNLACRPGYRDLILDVYREAWASVSAGSDG